MKESRLPKRKYTEEFKAEAIRLAASVGGHGAARRPGVLDIVDWIKGWYNRQCLDSANGYLAPVAWESARLAA